MRYGLAIPTCREGLAYPSEFATISDIERLGRLAERLGYDTLWANEHLITQRVILDTMAEPPKYFEPFITFAHLSSQTERIGFLFATIIAPIHHPLLLAKQVATLDHVSRGRVTLGLGAGAYAEEVRAVTSADLSAGSKRVEVTQECTEALRALFESRKASFAGRHFRFDEIEIYPPPLQNHLPIYLAGNSPAGIRRAAHLADGWIAASVSPEEVRRGVSRLRDEASKSGRDPGSIQVCIQLWISIGQTMTKAWQRLEASQHFQRLRAANPSATARNLMDSFAENNLLGTPGRIAQKVNTYRDAGADHLGLVFLASDVGELTQDIELFAEHVLRASDSLSGSHANGQSDVEAH